MPNIREMSRNYYINSENDIPEKYLEIIEKQLPDESASSAKEDVIVTPGKLGVSHKSIDEIKEAFSDVSQLYFGHGTVGDENVISSILQTGLKVKNPIEARAYDSHLRGLTSTSDLLGTGSETLFDESKESLENWTHMQAKNIVICSLPQELVLSKHDVGSGVVDLFKQFYIGSEEEGFFLRPEFIAGVYNADSHSFVENESFYKNLSEEKQASIIESVKKKYIKEYAENAIHSPYNSDFPLPLNKEEIEMATVEWYKTQLVRYREDQLAISDSTTDIFDENDLWEDLDEISSSAKMSDFEDTTNLLWLDVTHKKDEQKEKNDEGWTIDDDWN